MDRRGPRLAEQVLERLRDDIIRGNLPPGTPVIEADVSERLQVSRTPVREALIKLAEEGLVSIFPQRGSFVAPIQIHAVREAQFIRENLECALLAEAGERLTPLFLRRLADNLDRHERAARREDAEQLFTLDEEFHALLAEGTDKPGVWRIIQQAKTHLDRIRRRSVGDHGDVVRMLTQHREMLAALEAGDVPHAVAVMHQHLRSVFTTIERLEQQAATPLSDDASMDARAHPPGRPRALRGALRALNPGVPLRLDERKRP